MEDWWLLRKPLARPTVAAQVLENGCGALNVDACRVPTTGEPLVVQDRGEYRPNHANAVYGSGMGGGVGPDGRNDYVLAAGRWPANLLLDDSEEVKAAFERFGERSTRLGKNTTRTRTGAFGSGAPGSGGDVAYRDDTGTAARFFPALGFGEDELRFHYSAKASKHDRCGSSHPCVKPQSLLRWLARLITPPGGTILDPFAGSGSLGEAALREGFSAVLIEREAEYIKDIERRLARMRGEDGPLFAEAAA